MTNFLFQYRHGLGFFSPPPFFFRRNAGILRQCPESPPYDITGCWLETFPAATEAGLGLFSALRSRRLSFPSFFLA